MPPRSKRRNRSKHSSGKQLKPELRNQRQRQKLIRSEALSKRAESALRLESGNPDLAAKRYNLEMQKKFGEPMQRLAIRKAELDQEMAEQGMQSNPELQARKNQVCRRSNEDRRCHVGQVRTGIEGSKLTSNLKLLRSTTRRLLDLSGLEVPLEQPKPASTSPTTLNRSKPFQPLIQNPQKDWLMI
jgi:hypothetical protein